MSVQSQTNVALDLFDNNVLTLAMNNDAAGAMEFTNDSGFALVIGESGTLSGITSDAAGSTLSVVTADGLTVDKSIQAIGGLA